MSAALLLFYALLIALPLFAAPGLLVAAFRIAADREEAAALEASLAGPPVGQFDPASLAPLPEAARRYLARAIAPGTPLYQTVTLGQSGQFLLNGKAFALDARQTLAPRRGFLWRARLRLGPIVISGSDASGPAASWTRFALYGLIPVARLSGPDHARSAATRAVMEAVWCPTVLLPQNGAFWRQTGPDEAEVSFPGTQDLAPLRLTLTPEGLPLTATALRWSDANPDKIWRLQPFGGTLSDWREVQGVTLPFRVEMGNHWGTATYAPFFRVTLTEARF